MKVIKPKAFADNMLVSTTAVETVALWSASTTYANGDKARLNGRIYESVSASNVGNNPASSPLRWKDYGPDNARSMFDLATSTQTTATNSLTVVLQPGVINSVALIGLAGAQATVTLQDGVGGPVLFTTSISLDGTIITDWYQYLYEDTVQQSEWTLTNLPPYGTGVLTVTVTGIGPVGIGSLVMGTAYVIGEALTGSSLGTDDYSRVETDEFGTTTLTRRSSAKTSEMQIMVPRSQMRKVFQVLDDLRATPAVWIPSSRPADTPLTVYGIRSSFRIAIDYPTHVLCTLELKGMT